MKKPLDPHPSPPPDSPATRQVTLNGERRAIGAGTLAELVAELGLQDRKIAVLRNDQIVSRASYPETPVENGDRLEIIGLIGGG